MPAFPTVILGTLAGAVCAALFQFDNVIAFVHDDTLLPIVALVKGIWIAMFDGYVANTGVLTFTTAPGSAVVIKVLLQNPN